MINIIAEFVFGAIGAAVLAVLFVRTLHKPKE